MTLSVIGAGFGRTGTLTLKRALEQLGFGPCCHAFDERNVQQGEHFWQRVFNDEPIDWDEFFRGYRSTVDSPSCRFYLELSQKYPSAKVILTWRESRAWFESYQATVLPLAASPHGEKLYSFVLGGPARDEQSVIAAYERHNAEVQRLIPADRLLVYDVAQGWSPLCNFLGVPIPDAPFPHTNYRENFSLEMDAMLMRLHLQHTDVDA